MVSRRRIARLMRDSVPLWAGIYRTLCSDPTTEDRKRVGVRMPAGRGQWTRYKGRRPKASDERTRGTTASSWPSMGI